MSEADKLRKEMNETLQRIKDNTKWAKWYAVVIIALGIFIQIEPLITS